MPQCQRKPRSWHHPVHFTVRDALWFTDGTFLLCLHLVIGAEKYLGSPLTGHWLHSYRLCPHNLKALPPNVITLG